MRGQSGVSWFAPSTIWVPGMEHTHIITLGGKRLSSLAQLARPQTLNSPASDCQVLGLQAFNTEPGFF